MENEQKYCLYIHTRKDDGGIFYVGIGDEKRPYDKTGRNRFWKFVVKKHEYDVTILKTNMSWEQACDLEIKMIAFYGRKDKKKGSLVNMTDGGDGSKGLIHSEESKLKMREKRIGKYVGENHPSYNTKHSVETKQKQREKKIGKTGENASRSKKVICNITGKIYASLKEASEDFGIKRTTLNSWLTGQNPNRSSLRFL